MYFLAFLRTRIHIYMHKFVHVKKKIFIPIILYRLFMSFGLLSGFLVEVHFFIFFGLYTYSYTYLHWLVCAHKNKKKSYQRYYIDYLWALGCYQAFWLRCNFYVFFGDCFHTRIHVYIHYFVRIKHKKKHTNNII